MARHGRYPQGCHYHYRIEPLLRSTSFHYALLYLWAFLGACPGLSFGRVKTCQDPTSAAWSTQSLAAQMPDPSQFPAQLPRKIPASEISRSCWWGGVATVGTFYGGFCSPFTVTSWGVPLCWGHGTSRIGVIFSGLKTLRKYAGWWFGTFSVFHNMWDNPSHWLIFLKMVKTINQYLSRTSRVLLRFVAPKLPTGVDHREAYHTSGQIPEGFNAQRCSRIAQNPCRIVSTSLCCSFLQCGFDQLCWDARVNVF